MIAHHRVGTDIDGEDRLQLEDPGSDPVAAMRKVLPRMRIHTTQVLAPDAP